MTIIPGERFAALKKVPNNQKKKESNTKKIIEINVYLPKRQIILKKKLKEIKMFKIIIGAIMGIFVLIFLIQNPEIVELKFLNMSIELPRAIIIILAIATGFIWGWISKSIRNLKKKHRKEKEKKSMD